MVRSMQATLWRRGIGGFALWVALMAFSGLAQAQQAEVARAQQLLNQNRPAEAYEYLLPFEDRYAGNVEFDYVLGISALDSGKSDKATLAFERVLAVNPNFAGARLDMARAYFQLGDADRAKAEFLTVRELNPPAQAQAVITQYLDAIEKIERAKKRSLRSYVEFQVGRDTNVNNSGTSSSIAVPALGGLLFTLSPTNIKRPDGFKAIGAGAEFNYLFRPDLGAFVGADFRQRANFTQDTFDNASYDSRAGMSFGESSNQLRVTGQTGRYTLDNDLSRRSEGLSGEWKYAINPANQLNAFSQFSRNRFTAVANQVNNFNSSTSGLGYMRVVGDGQAVILANYLFGKERDPNGRADGAKRVQGFRVGGQYMFSENIDFFTMATVQRMHYEKQNASFLAFRNDETSDLTLGMNWRFMKNWTLKPQWVYSKNVSSVPIYAYERNEVSVTVRRDFN
jgi:tetratricopeptide (TPR) repeat protein